MSLILRPTVESDLLFVVEAEREAAQERFVTPETIERHEDYLSDPDVRHLILESNGKSVGYAILAGLTNTDETIEFRRMVVTEKGQGHGRRALQKIKKIAFEELNAHRLWLDVKDFNRRARRLYEGENFSVEGVWREHLKTENGRESIVFMAILRSEFLVNES